jgi:outer membrane protein TolC
MTASRLTGWLFSAAISTASVTALADTEVTYARALALSRERAPIAAVARTTEAVAEADSRVPGIYPNPSVQAGTNSLYARMTLGVTVPLVVLGQRGAALRAGKAGLAVAKLDTEVTLADVRAATGRAFVSLWLSEHTAHARADAAQIAAKLEDVARGRVELGSAPELDGLRAHAASLRAEVDARSASAMVDAAAAELAVWVGASFAEPLRAAGDPDVPPRVPQVSELWQLSAQSPAIQRALAEANASEARAESERAQLRPLMTLDLGAELYDPTQPGVNYRAALGVELPLFNQRGPLIEREERSALRARSQARAEQAQVGSALVVAYRTFSAMTLQVEALSSGVLPAAVSAARATEESYALGRAPLVSVLDAERARIDTELTLFESQGARANAWIDLQRALGAR